MLDLSKARSTRVATSPSLPTRVGGPAPANVPTRAGKLRAPALGGAASRARRIGLFDGLIERERRYRRPDTGDPRIPWNLCSWFMRMPALFGLLVSGNYQHSFKMGRTASRAAALAFRLLRATAEQQSYECSTGDA